jgi:hypothetical protein
MFGFLVNSGLGLFIAGLWIKRRWTKPREPRLSIYMGIVFRQAENRGWQMIHYVGFGL